MEENRRLLEQLAACQAQVTALQAAAAMAALVPPCCPEPPPLLEQPEQRQRELPRPQQQQQQRYPAIFARPASQQATGHGGAVDEPSLLEVPPSVAAQLSRVKRALADQLGDPAPLAQQPHAQQHPAPQQPCHTTLSLPASAAPDEHAASEAHQGAVPSSQPPPAAAPPPQEGDMQRVFSELQALQRRLQAAEERLQLQAGNAEQRRPPPSPHRVSGGGSRPASPGIAARRPASPARQKGQEHRDSYQLIRELKQRRARLEAERLAAAAAALASGAPPRGAGACSPPAAGAPASGARAAPWLFDTRDLPPGAALHQPLPRQAVASGAAGRTGGWAQQGAAYGSRSAGLTGGSRSSGTSPMAWHAANQQLPGTAGAGTRGRRRSLSAVSKGNAGCSAASNRGACWGACCPIIQPQRLLLLAAITYAFPCPYHSVWLQEPRRSASGDRREPLQLSNRRRSTSRSRSEREELDRLLMAGQPTTLLASGSKGAAGGAVGRSGTGQRSKAGAANGGSWVSPLVLA